MIRQSIRHVYCPAFLFPAILGIASILMSKDHLLENTFDLFGISAFVYHLLQSMQVFINLFATYLIGHSGSKDLLMLSSLATFLSGQDILKYLLIVPCSNNAYGDILIIISLANSRILTGSPMSSTNTSPPLPIAAACRTRRTASDIVIK